jgi:hypothetical protein
MKKNLLISVQLIFVLTSFAQTNTNLGTSAGNSGNNNTSIGAYAGDAVTGDNNTSIGYGTGYVLTSGTRNSFIGYASGISATTGGYNTFLGSTSGYANTTASYNTAIGDAASYSNTTGTYNCALGYQSLYSNTASSNTAAGYQSLYSNTTGTENTALGYKSLYANTSGINNIAIGNEALSNYNTSGSSNIGIGVDALIISNGNGNTAVGYGAFEYNISGHYNTAIGYRAGNTGIYTGDDNQTAIGAETKTTAANQVRIGDANVTSIGGQVGWTTLSDGRFKTDIKDDVTGLDFINKLRPVSYFVNKESFNKFIGISERTKNQQATERAKPIRRSGFVAQEVEEVAKKLGIEFSGVDAPKNDKDYYGLRYDEFVVPLVKAVQELSSKVEEQQRQIELLLAGSSNNSESLDPKSDSRKATIFQNNPNPFNVDTEIKMILPKSAAKANVIIYNMEGVELLSIPVQNRGDVSVKVQANQLKAGMFFYALIVDDKVIGTTKRLILTK